jgi:hypothetical protein
MTDSMLLSIGCGVSFIFFAGCYIQARERFTRGPISETQKSRKSDSKLGRMDLAADSISNGLTSIPENHVTPHLLKGSADSQIAR